MIVFNTNILDVNKDDIAVTKTEYRGWTQMQLLKHPRSPPGFSSVAQSLVSCEHILSLSFVLSVALRFTASTRRFGIVKLFLQYIAHLHYYICKCSQFQVNYLSHLLLTLELLPIMKQSGDDNRIVLVSSSAHEYHTTPFSVENIAAKQYNKESFPRFKYYGNSKLYQVFIITSILF